MVLLPCWLKGHRLKLQTAQVGKDAGEYCFVCSKPSCGREECLVCRAKYCEYGFNLPPLKRNKKLREKVINYVYDASLDDELLLEGLVPIKSFELRMSKIKGKVYSKPCFDEETGKRLVAIEDIACKLHQKADRAEDRLARAVNMSQPLPPRVMLKKKKRGKCTST